MTTEQLQSDYAANCRRSSREWMELSERLPGSLRTFALSRAADNLEIAQRIESRVTVRGTDQPHKLEQPSATLGPATTFIG